MTILITGGTGFLGSAIVKRQLENGHRVRILDNNSRGNIRRLKSVIKDVEFIEGDIRDKSKVLEACKGVNSVMHLAYINGTEFFYSMPELVLDVGVKGMINVIDGCIKYNVSELILASSSEVYQSAMTIPTNEDVPLVIPDIQNPRYSYGGGKIISELMAINYGKKYFERVIIFRPHNVYGPDMGSEHVIPAFVKKMELLSKDKKKVGVIKFPIQGTGKETRAFIYIDDFVEGLMMTINKGHHLGVYHIGTNEEISINELAQEVGNCFNRKIKIIPGQLMEGGPSRRCPDISKLEKFGFQPIVTIKNGLKKTIDWHLNFNRKNLI